MRTLTARVGALVLVVAVLLTACDSNDVYGLKVERVGGRCSGSGFARTSKNVLQCKRGRWTVSMSISRAIALIDQYNSQVNGQPPVPTEPPPTTVPPGPVVTAATTGYRHTCVLVYDGTVSCFGSNTFGQLGNSTNTATAEPSWRPVSVEGLTGVTAIATGDFHTCALRFDGTVSCFGSNVNGQLGNSVNQGTGYPNPTPAVVAGLTGITAITAGENHTCALKVDGTVSCFGFNTSGQLADSSLYWSATPIAVAGLNNITAITAGSNHNCALRNDGTVSCFGGNGFGQLGNGTGWGSSNGKNSTPTVVEGLIGVTAITAGESHTCALRNDGTVTCFGENYLGQLGNGTVYSTATPIPVDGLTGITAIAAGSNHTCALKSETTMTCFGSNAFGQLGNPANAATLNANRAPLPVSGIVGIAAMSLGAGHTCALNNDGRVSCFGSNSSGQLGNSTNSGSDSANPQALAVHW